VDQTGDDTAPGSTVTITVIGTNFGVFVLLFVCYHGV
jgi:hypothetical protein